MNIAQKAAVGGALIIATITGGAVGASFMGVAGAQTTDDSTTTTAPATSDSTQKPKAGADGENCPDKAAANESATTSS